MARRFSPWNLVDRNASLLGNLALSDLPRLHDIASGLEELNYSIQGQTNLLGQPSLHVQLKGQLHLSCERCLQTMPFRLDCDSELLLKTEVQAATRSGEHELSDDCDVLIAERDDKLDALELLQDEILLALPLVPAHSKLEDCGEKVVTLLSTPSNNKATTENGETETTTKPFAGLADLLGKAD